MLRLKTKMSQSFLLVENPNDVLLFVSSIQKKLNDILSDNDERDIKKIKIQYGASKKTSEQLSEEYEGVKGFVTLLKKSLSAGDQGYFEGKRDRWKYKVASGEKERYIKFFDNHIKINFKCKTAKEREILKTLVVLLFTFNNSDLDCVICDLDYIADSEIIKDELFEVDVFIYARTVLKFSYENNQEPLKNAEYESGLVTKKKDNEENKDEDDLLNGFL